MAAGEIGLQLGMALSTAGAEQGTEVPTARLAHVTRSWHVCLIL